MATTPRAGRGADSTANADSNAQTTSGEPSHRAANDPERRLGEGSEVQHFPGSVAKRRADGTVALSDYVEGDEQIERPDDPADVAEGERRSRADRARADTRDTPDTGRRTTHTD